MVVNNAAMNTGVHVSFRIAVSPNIYPGMGLKDHMVALSFLRKLLTSFHTGASSASPVAHDITSTVLWM